VRIYARTYIYVFVYVFDVRSVIIPTPLQHAVIRYIIMGILVCVFFYRGLVNINIAVVIISYGLYICMPEVYIIESRGCEISRTQKF
jgi:hypothetical protein